MNLRHRLLAVFSERRTERLFGAPDAESLVFMISASPPDDEHWVVESPLAVHVLNQLASEGFASEKSQCYCIDWDDLYSVLESGEFENSIHHLGLPKMGALRPRLRSANSLDDDDFEVAIEGWLDEQGRTDVQKVGAIARTATGYQLLPRASYALSKAISDFWALPERSAESNRLHWSRIRALALRANAGLDQFLASTVVLTPEKLIIKLANKRIGGSDVVEVQPWFAGAPDGWLRAFDVAGGVRDRYQIATDEGLTEVQITPKVKTVLKAVKAMPGRRASGSMAEKFLHNPFATLGIDANDVIDEQQFENARREAGIEFQRFAARVRMRGSELEEVAVVVETLGEQRRESVLELFDLAEDLKAFISRVETKLQMGFELCEWRGHHLQFTGDTSEQIEVLRAAYIEWTKPRVVIRAVDVLDLSRYSQRVAGIGVQRRVISPYIPNQAAGDPWFPETPLGAHNIAVSVPLDDGRTFELIVDPRVRDTIEAAVKEAEDAGRDKIEVPGHSGVVSVSVARAILKEMETHYSKSKPTNRNQREKTPVHQRQELLLRANIGATEFSEERALDLKVNPGFAPQLPRCLLPGVTLKNHQLFGIAWMQHLFSRSPDQCRGAVLADDMGLGKTLQLLALIFRALEKDPSLEPVLIVAPVSLLENWREEAERFFGKDRPLMLTLYGDTLHSLRAPRSAIDEELVSKGIIRFLKTGWRGDAKIVLTTYETLRDLEFSLAMERWSIMVCDEAQKIKNPAAMVTRAAKKQNVRFRIACTGTPVENTLADLWCLFDFIQPGLLGSLNEFGATYRRPIECETEEQRARVEQLRQLIDPQILRRTKKDVASDLQPKVVVKEPRTRESQELNAVILKLSEYQRMLYGNALELFKLRSDPSRSVPFKNHLGLLQYLRKICISPSEYGERLEGRSLATLFEENPKLEWLARALGEIRAKSEKAIVFCEFRDVQLMLAHVIEQVFRFRPDIINGDTEASARSVDSRQKRIKRFQNMAGFGVIVLSPLAVGFGVNIQAANHVIHFSRTWNPAKEDQATDRAYRIGQTKPVYVYYPVVCADDFTTFDLKLHRLLERKRTLSDDMLNGSGDLSPTDFKEIVDVDDRVFDEQITCDHLPDLSPQELEALVAALWKKIGFRTVQLIGGAGDGGIDVIAKTVDKGALIQCKCSVTEGARLSWDAIKDVVAGEARYKFENPGVDFKKVAVTNQFFNENAKFQAQLNSVELVDQQTLADLLQKYRVVRGEIEMVLVAPLYIGLKEESALQTMF